MVATRHSSHHSSQDNLLCRVILLFSAWSGTKDYKWEQDHSSQQCVAILWSTVMLGVSVGHCRQAKCSRLGLCGVLSLQGSMEQLISSIVKLQEAMAAGSSYNWIFASQSLWLRVQSWLAPMASATHGATSWLFYTHCFLVSAGSDFPFVSLCFKLCCWVTETTS